MHRDEENAICQAAARLPAKERAAYLDRVRPGDPALRDRIVQALFEAAARTGGGPQADPGAKTVAIAGPQPQSFEQPGDAIGRYDLLERLAEGLVYVARKE